MEYNLPQIRSLTRKEIKAMREAGCDLVRATDGNIGQASSKMVDYILDVIFKDFDFDAIPQDECNKFAIAVYRKTYGTGEDAKK